MRIGTDELVSPETVGQIEPIMTIMAFGNVIDVSINHRFTQFVCKYLSTTYVKDKQGSLL